MNSPAGLAFDNGGNLYVANAGANTIRKFDPLGNADDLRRKSGVQVAAAA